MHNLKEIRKNHDLFKKRLSDRNIDFNVADFSSKDKENRD